MNLWSIPLDAATGVTNGPPRRLTRGPGIVGQLSLGANGQKLVYFSSRLREPELFLRDLETGTETIVAAEPANAMKGFPALSPSGIQLAHGMLVPGPRALRPIVVLDLANGSVRQLSSDSGGRPRQWMDERYLLIETFSQLNSLVLVDTTTGSQREFLSSATRSVSNPRISPDGARVAFDATPRGGSPAVFVAPVSRDHMSVPESDWIVIDEDASHPFWSADGRLLYYLSIIPNHDLRSGARARRIDVISGRPEGDPFHAIALREMFVPTTVPGTAPVIASDEVVCVLADLRGDIWVMSF
jgi:Tol biopolymer transport system component